MKYLLRSVAILSLMSFASCAQAAPSELETAEIEAIVKAYLMENPEVIRDALLELDRKQVREAEQKTIDALDTYADQLFRDPRDYAIGPKDAKVQIVEFFDYNCGFCKRSTDWVEETLAAHPDDVRFVFKELPVLTGRDGTSYTAAKSVLAAARQGKYKRMHFALMDERALTKDRILQVAKVQGLNVKQLETDMADPAILRQIEDNLDLTRNIPAITGTPFFIVNDEYVAGASMDKLEEMLANALGT